MGILLNCALKSNNIINNITKTDIPFTGMVGLNNHCKAYKYKIYSKYYT